MTLDNVPAVIASPSRMEGRGNLITSFSSPPRFFAMLRMTGVGGEIATSSFRGRTPRDDKKKNSDSRLCSERQREISLLEITTVSVANVPDKYGSLTLRKLNVMMILSYPTRRGWVAYGKH